MSNFVVSARKYRPQRFDEVVGQEHVSQTLKNALQHDHLAHAFLFCGPRGVGKTTCARILAKVLNCQQPTEDFEPCNRCASCQAFNENASFNITELDAASNNSVEHIRSLIEQVRFQPQQGKYKVFIIDEVHMLSSQAFNAFLKTLEEPPGYAIFILATTEKHKIIPTILSRCQIFDFRRIQVADMVSHLKGICEQEGIQAEESALHVIAEKADGALRDALSIFDRMVSFDQSNIRYETVIDQLNVLDHDYYFRITDTLLSEDLPGGMNILHEIIHRGFEPDIFLSGLTAHLRNLMVCKDPQTIQLLEVSPALQKRYQQQASLTPRAFLLSALNLANDCAIHYRMAGNKRLHVELALMKMTYLQRTLEQPLQVPEKKTPAGTDSEEKVTSEPEPPVEEATEELSNKISPEKQQQFASRQERPEKEAEPSPSEEVAPSSELQTGEMGIGKLGQWVEQVAQKEKEAPQVIPKLELQAVQEAWATYVESVESKYVQSLLKNVRIELPGKHALKVWVGKKINRDSIIAESGLKEHLREQLQCPPLQMEVAIDSEMAPEEETEQKPQKPTSVKEKYEAMVSVNPMLEELCRRLQLKADRS